MTDGLPIEVRLVREDGSDDPADAEWFSEDDAVTHSSDLSPEFPDGWDDDRCQAAYEAPWTEPGLLWVTAAGDRVRFQRVGGS